MLIIQDPLFEDSILLHEMILDTCMNAKNGAGAFAFVTADGLNLLMKDSIFVKFINRGKFFLVIGMDEVTNTRTLETLNCICDRHPNLSVKAFLHKTNGSTFHPKFCWFEYDDGGYIITGSGNLTQKGLRRNREAYLVEKLTDNELRKIKEKWDDWLICCKDCLKNIDDTEVIEKAKENTRKAIDNVSKKHKQAVPKKNTTRRTPTFEDDSILMVDEKEVVIVECDDEFGAWEFDEDSDALIAEIPIGRKRTLKKWCQANFSIETFKSFFEAEPHRKKQLVLRKVTSSGLIQDIETPTTISKNSQNYCFELTPPENTLYPSEGRPIGVFVKLSPRTFLYMVMMPGEDGYLEMEHEIDKHRVRIDRLVRYETKVTELIKIYKDLAILDYVT